MFKESVPNSYSYILGKNVANRQGHPLEGRTFLLGAESGRLGVRDLVGTGALDVLEVVERLLLGMLLEEDVALEPPWESDGELVGGELADGDGEDPVELL